MFYDDRIEERINSDDTTIDKIVKNGEGVVEITLRVLTDGKSPLRLKMIEQRMNFTQYFIKTDRFEVPVENPSRLFKLAESKIKEREEKIKKRLLENL